MCWITAGYLLVKEIWSHLKVTRALTDIWQASETNHSKSSLGNFHQYLAELLVNVYSYHLVVKSVSCCCVCGRRLFTNPVTIDPNDFNAEKVPAQQWFVPQATCSLGVCHGRQTQTGMEFSSAISYTYGLCFSFLVIQLIVFNDIILLITRSYLCITQASSSLKSLDICMFICMPHPPS